MYYISYYFPLQLGKEEILKAAQQFLNESNYNFDHRFMYQYAIDKELREVCLEFATNQLETDFLDTDEWLVYKSLNVKEDKKMNYFRLRVGVKS